MHTGAILLGLQQPAHPPWPHRHPSPEGALLKAVLISAVLIGGPVFAAIRAWRRWRRRLRPTDPAGRAHARSGRRGRRR